MSQSGRTDTKLKKEKLRKKLDDVGKLSPTHSEMEEKITFKVIDGEDIQQLAIREEDLKKLTKIKEISSETKEKHLFVKKKDKNIIPQVEFKVAKLAPDRPIKPIDVSENLGIRFDKYGNCIPYSILGSVEEFLKEAANHGKSISLVDENLDSDRLKADEYIIKKEKTKRHHRGSFQF